MPPADHPLHQPRDDHLGASCAASCPPDPPQTWLCCAWLSMRCVRCARRGGAAARCAGGADCVERGPEAEQASHSCAPCTPG
eukprot:3823441-Rhodomonas_salina.1